MAMIQRYQEAWNTYTEKYGPRTAVLYQVGGFFEIYDIENPTTGKTRCNIKELADLCQLVLAVKTLEDGQQTLFGGFPDHALPKFERTLVQAGYTVVVFVQKKDSKGAVESRIVDHISSPGCYMEGNKERRLVGVVLERITGGPSALQKVYWAAAAFDVATGSTWFVEGVERDRLHQFLCTYPPSELVIWTDGLSSVAQELKASCTVCHLKCLGSPSAALDEAALAKVWSRPVYMAAVGRLPQARRCLGALMDFVVDHMPHALKDLDGPVGWTPENEVRLGNAALEQLGVVNLRDPAQSLLGIMDKCRSSAGKRLLRARLMRPRSDIEGLRSLTAAFANIPTGTDTDKYLRSMYDTSRIFRRLELGTATIGDMACLIRSYEASASLLKLWGREPDLVDHLQTILGSWDVHVLQTLSKEAVTIPTSGLPLNDFPDSVTTVFEVGRALRAEVDALCGQYSSALNSGKVNDTLYIDEADGGGFRISGTKRRINSAHAILRDMGDTTAKITPYKTSAVLETSALLDISERHQAWYADWSRIWIDTWSTVIADFVSANREAHRRIEVACADIDVTWTVHGLSTAWGWTIPEYVTSDDAWVQGEGLRHPLIELVNRTVPYVAQTVGLGLEHSGLLLYGMNASGKSSLMKSIGLCTILAQCGFPVPASKFRIAPFRAIFTRILGNDNLWAGLSSFAVEMTEFREILRLADSHSLVLGDELCSGTESLSATALVAAGIETLVSRRAKFLFATHLHELAGLIGTNTGVQISHLAVHYDDATDTLVYDRVMKPSSGSALYGLEVCRALDMPVDFIERAAAIRKRLTSTPHTSVYSSESVVDCCGVCGSSEALETHHIRQQAGFSGPEVDLNAPHNLVCLCDTCHDDHHAGRLDISGWEDTAAGRRLVWSQPQKEEPMLSPDIIAFIKDERALKRRVATIQRVAEQRFGLKLSEAAIRGVR